MKCCEECPGDESCEHNKYCVCGSEIEAHYIGSGHSPVSVHDYYIRELTKDGAKENDGKTTNTNGGSGYKRSGYER